MATFILFGHKMVSMDTILTKKYIHFWLTKNMKYLIYNNL